MLKYLYQLIHNYICSFLKIQVNVAGGVLGVEAKHEEKGDNKFVLRQFSRKYTLPEVSYA